MIKIFADDVLAYDSRMEKYNLLGLSITTGLNKGGAAEITMPPGHPAYNLFVSHRTIVTIYRDDKLRFRGRALYPTDDYYNQRKITCEGELCLFQDGVSRPYLYTSSPFAILVAVVAEYNAQVEPFKQFSVGQVTVTDNNDYVRLESESAETCLDTLNKLLERCGGYFVFETDEDGNRVINWLASIDNSNNQEIEFGENLLDFSRGGANTTMATGIIPYGAKDEQTGKLLTIESVNGGLDYLIAEDARAVRGTIMVSVTWDDVTEPDNLLTKAREYLEENKYLVTALELTALDLSYMDKSLDNFKVGDTILVKSAPHGVNDRFQLTELTEDLLDPSKSSVKLGKTVTSLTAAAVAGEAANKNAQASIVMEASTNTEQVVAAAEERIMSVIRQEGASIELSVSGCLGGQAAIMLTVGTTPQTQTLDLSNVRQAFADDHSDIVIAAGTVTFDVGTLRIKDASGNQHIISVSENGDLICSQS